MSVRNRRDFLKISGGALAATSLAGVPSFAQSGPVKVGVLASRSGVLGSIGECALVTTQWWADRVNASGGILGRKVELVVEEETNAKDTVERFLPYWHETIVPSLKSGKKVIIAAHGNSLRALVKYLDNISDDEIVGLNIPTGIPLVYELDDDLKPLKSYYLGDQEAIKKAQEAVAAQGKAKA